MLALESLAMRASTFFLLAVIVTSSARAQEQTQTESAPRTDGTSETQKPELTRRSLPTDTFKPSEEISEDYPVPFPVDI
jgi:hypothetical protein